MALFQPTNIAPSSMGQLGNGTVDITQGLNVSWQVNGNSPMTAFQIVIYQNDTESTQVYSTGKLTDQCPFYGTDSKGQTRRFSYQIDAEELSELENGENYKLIITQWWSETESILQTSASAFVTRETPSISIDTIPSPLAVNAYTFSATYEQEQGDTLNWVRWQIAEIESINQPFFDSGEIYGTAQLQVEYDGFFPSKNSSTPNYAIKCQVETENGVIVDTGWVEFTVYYATSQLTGYVEAKKVCGGSTAVRVSWPNISYIPGTEDGTYTIDSGRLILPTGSSVTWDEVNGSAMNFTPIWTILWRGQLTGQNATLFSIVDAEGDTLSLKYTAQTGTLALMKNQTVLAQTEAVSTAYITAILTPEKIYARKEEKFDGLHPETDLYPLTTLYPRASVTPVVTTLSDPVDYLQNAITEISIAGNVICDYLEIREGVLSQEDFNAAYVEDTYRPVFGAETYFLADFVSNLDAGNLISQGQNLTGFSVYRRRGETGILQHVIDLGISDKSFYDYGTASQQGDYTYYVYPTGSNSYIAEPLVSSPVNPVFWDYALLECNYLGDGYYTVDREYTWGKNLSTGEKSNNNKPSIFENFTRYPTVQLSAANYKSGQLTSLIGKIDYAGGQNAYSDTVELADAIFALSTSMKTMFLKTRKGEILRVRPSADLRMATGDNEREQSQTLTFPWVETGSAENISITANTIAN